MKEFIHETISLGYDDLVADTQPSGRTYIDPDGNRYPSITTVLSILNEEELAAWRKRVGDAEANKIGNRAAARGTHYWQRSGLRRAADGGRTGLAWSCGAAQTAAAGSR